MYAGADTDSKQRHRPRAADVTFAGHMGQPCSTGEVNADEAPDEKNGTETKGRRQ